MNSDILAVRTPTMQTDEAITTLLQLNIKLNTEEMWQDAWILHSVIRRGIRSGLCAPDHMSLEELVTDADDKLIFYTVNTMFTLYTSWSFRF